ncbi:MAG: DUF4097 family beta strand repeat-containing protein [Acidobacteriota bacterium]|nr:DUF4097 family beta strand repeat-containing protein [Acidobacteriota bacterium]
MKKIMMLLVIAVLPSVAADELISKNWSFQPNGDVIVDVSGARVEVEPGSGNEVTARIEMNGSRSWIDDYEWKFQADGNRIRIEGKRDNSGWGSGWGWGRRSVVVTLTVPSRTNMEVRTSGGRIVMRDISGVQDLRTSGGSIKLADVNGDITARTSGGSVTVEGGDGNKTLKTSGGSIRVTDVGGDIDARTSGGSIRLLGVDGAVMARTSGGGIDIELVGENRGVEARTSGGSISLRMDKTSGANLSARTSGGRVVCDLPLTVRGKIDKRNVKGELNGGGPDIILATSGGSIRIE